MKKEIYAISQDPIHIGTGGYCIGRVDNTIVRDPISKIPKIPGTSLAGTWRYYTALELHSYFKDEYKTDRSKRRAIKTGEEKELFKSEIQDKDWVTKIKGNRYAAIKCAGQDDKANFTVSESKALPINKDAGHCGECIICQTFGFSKRDESQRGMAYFSDLNILLFPLYTRLGTRWITSKSILDLARISIKEELNINDDEVAVFEDEETEGRIINLGWLNFITKPKKSAIKAISETLPQTQREELFKLGISNEKIIIVSDNLVSQIINSNLETRTSVSIDPITGAAKDRALFTSEAIPRGTVFYGEILVEVPPLKEDVKDGYVFNALKDSSKYFETLGIGGMTTRGFGRISILDWGQ